jgi:hypothetical protein
MARQIAAGDMAEPQAVFAIVRHGHGRHSVRRVVRVDGDVFSVKWETLADLTLREAHRFIGAATLLDGIWQEPIGVRLANTIVPL